MPRAIFWIAVAFMLRKAEIYGAGGGVGGGVRGLG